MLGARPSGTDTYLGTGLYIVICEVITITMNNPEA